MAAKYGVRLTSGDVTTTGGLLGEYDAQVAALADSKGWCSSWKHYCYDLPGIARPEGRDAITAVSASVLTDEGKTLQEAALTKLGLTFEGLQEKIRAAAVSAVERGRTITGPQLASIMSTLGMAGHAAKVRAYAGYLTVSTNFTTPKVIPAATRKALSEQIKTAVDEAVNAAVAAAEGTVTRMTNAEVNQDAYASERQEWRDGPAPDKPVRKTAAKPGVSK